jgi:hypothetical protein
MNRSTPANDTRNEPNDYTDRAEYTDDAAEAASQAADTARCFTWADALIERGVIGEGQRDEAERAMMAMLTAGTSSGPRDDRARDLVRRMLIAASKPTPVQGFQNATRAALVRVLRARQWTPGVLHSLHRIDPAFRAVTREIYEREIASDDLVFAARLSVAVGAFGDRDVARSLDAFRVASREQSRKPRKR